jgi:hypothetical protein
MIRRFFLEIIMSISELGTHTNQESFSTTEVEPGLMPVVKLEQRLLYTVDQIDRGILEKTLQTTIMLPNGVEGEIKAILEDKVLRLWAIEGALEAYDSFNERVGKVPEDDWLKARAVTKDEMLASVTVLERANKRDYNGRSAAIQGILQFKLGQYLAGGADVANQVAQLSEVQPSPTTEHLIFEGDLVETARR